MTNLVFNISDRVKTTEDRRFIENIWNDVFRIRIKRYGKNTIDVIVESRKCI